MNDFSNALSSAKSFDSKISADATKISSDYASIVALSVRQAIGATEITVSRDENGGFNTSDIMVFMKGSPVLYQFYCTTLDT